MFGGSLAGAHMGTDGLTGGRMYALAISQRVIASMVSDSSGRTRVMTVTGFLNWPGRRKRLTRMCHGGEEEEDRAT